jgi:uncharacterized protein (DUF1697 family)
MADQMNLKVFSIPSGKNKATEPGNMCGINTMTTNMKTYISILRGINVGGHKKILMIDLKALFEKSGFKNVATYIQSGNILFQEKENVSTGQLVVKIRNAISQRYQFDVPVIVRSLSEMQKTLTNNPFIDDKTMNVEKLHVTFLAEIPEKESLRSINKLDYSPDKFIIIGNDVFLYCPGSYGDTKLSNNFFENKLKVAATTRNWKTVNTLVELAKQL